MTVLNPKEMLKNNNSMFGAQNLGTFPSGTGSLAHSAFVPTVY